MTEFSYDVVYVDMVGDLFHYGHVEYLKRCKSIANVLKVGIHDDATVASYKRVPVLTMEERIKVVEACKYVDEVIPSAPLHVTVDFIDKHHIDKVVHADDISTSSVNSMYADIIDRMIFVPYTKGISTTLLIHRIKNREDLM